MRSEGRGGFGKRDGARGGGFAGKRDEGGGGSGKRDGARGAGFAGKRGGGHARGGGGRAFEHLRGTLGGGRQPPRRVVEDRPAPPAPDEAPAAPGEPQATERSGSFAPSKRGGSSRRQLVPGPPRSKAGRGVDRGAEPKPARTLTARELAIQVLARVQATDAYLNLVLDTALDETTLADPRDASLVTELCYGAVRRQLTLDYVLAPLCTRPLASIEPEVMAALRLGVYQRFFTRIPPHAAVGDTVEALKRTGLARAAGFVNAVLRKVVAMESPPLPPESDGDLHLAIKHSHPAWLVQRWLRQFGRERAEAMLAADNDAPSLVVRANSAKVSRDELVTQLREVGVACHPTTLSPDGVVLESPGRVEDVYGYAEGLWQVQDEAAQLVTLYAQVPETARVLDVCAAPGGKSCHLAQTNDVTSLDVHANKLRKIEAEARRLEVVNRVHTRAHDARAALPEDLGEFDAVIVDAPCSGLGTLRRHPELRYRRREADFAGLATLQREILENAHHAVAPGGLLVYAVCSTDSSEGPDQVELFLRSHPEYTTEPPAGLAHLPTWQGHLRTLPGPEGLDGFFAARLRKQY